MTGGVPDSGGGLGKAASSDGDGGGGVGGSRQEDPPTLDTSYDSPSGGREGGKRISPQHGTSQEMGRQSSQLWKPTPSPPPDLCAQKAWS